jgi:hypothetical protein
MAWKVFDKYYSMTDQNVYYAAGLILSPDRRTKYIQRNWKPKWKSTALKAVKALWVEYREQMPLSSYETPKERGGKELDIFDQAASDLKAAVVRPSSEDEYEDYISGEPYDIGNKSALSWWCEPQQKRRYPRLSLMAIDILSMPAMSAEPERVFSGARRTISWDRAQLSPESIDKGECLKHWMRSGILDIE